MSSAHSDGFGGKRAFPSALQPVGWRTVSTYLLAALVSTLLNILVQEAVRRLDATDTIAVPMAAGTIAGFVAKYALDKLVVFADAYRDPKSELRKVLTYGLFSVGTTLVFWASELAFWWAWHTSAARYTGAVLGLAIGYAAKFLLDRAFVFRDAPA